jgi:excisionase family DNA binding protein
MEFERRVVHRSTCRLGLAPSVWLDADAPKGGRRVWDGAVLIIFPLLRTRTKGIQRVSLHASRASVLIIMANSETEMIFTPRWYTVAQVAQLLNYGESKVRMLIITGQLRSIKDGRSRRILPEWVEAYVQDRAKASEDIW